MRDRTVTSWPSLQTDLRNAGATWEDREVVVDDNLITSRNPDDIPAFTRELTARPVSNRDRLTDREQHRCDARRAQAWAGVGVGVQPPRGPDHLDDAPMISVSPKSLGVKTAATPGAVSARGVGVGDDAADDHRHVAGAGRRAARRAPPAPAPCASRTGSRARRSARPRRPRPPTICSGVSRMPW